MAGFDPELADILARRSAFEVTVEELHHKHKLTIEGPHVPDVLIAHANNNKALLGTIESRDKITAEVIYPDMDAHPLPEEISDLPENDSWFEY